MPEKSEIVIDKLNIAMKPYFAKGVWTATGRNLEWGRINGSIIEGSQVRATHGIINYFKPEKYSETTPSSRRPRPARRALNPARAPSEMSMGT